MNRYALGLFAASAAATTGYVLLARKVRRGATRDEDRAARREVQDHASPRAKRLAEATGHIGSWYTHVPAAVAGAAALMRGRRHVAAGTVAGASLAAAALSRILDRVHDHRTPPPGKTRIDPDAQSFPSGHALETTAVALAGGWVLVRESLAPVSAALPTAIAASVVSGVGRLILDRHWTTDSIGGYCAGIALGTACAGVYELVRSAT